MNNNKKKIPWPTKKAMTQVYASKLWGSNNSSFYSGEGSHLDEITKPYLTSITSFLKSFENPISICDLGCGDFNIGKNLVKHTSNYIAIDIVEGLIERNKKKFTSSNLEFKCLDISLDNLPVTDCVILRQVLQHLSNNEIISILSKLTNYKYVILTEHIPENDFEPNKDIISGQGIRLKKNSGVNILKAPFNFKVKDTKELNSYSLKNNKGKIVTNLFII